eukprot:CAMPEP_0195513624 /NCGR_PEP_ID=MMETSP0794_2-20130614/5235_1 /TAXON_ID=515487 /ORGANISM="Stephanopyxis turris, Strain CCMP 815" /LENGTH=141 /DNA_ID=CAMNT_0040641683 /DNA_START=435 /DNA_END=860 /DNA_ORIENTATION=-
MMEGGNDAFLRHFGSHQRNYAVFGRRRSGDSSVLGRRDSSSSGDPNNFISGTHDEQTRRTSLDTVQNEHAPASRRGSFFGAMTKSMTKKRRESNERVEETTWDSKYKSKAAKAYRKELKKRVADVASSHGYIISERNASEG